MQNQHRILQVLIKIDIWSKTIIWIWTVIMKQWPIRKSKSLSSKSFMWWCTAIWLAQLYSCQHLDWRRMNTSISLRASKHSLLWAFISLPGFVFILSRKTWSSGTKMSTMLEFSCLLKLTIYSIGSQEVSSLSLPPSFLNSSHLLRLTKI